jgi:WD40 repeat protein
VVPRLESEKSLLWLLVAALGTAGNLTAVAADPAPDQKPRVATDAYGDPLPPGAIARLGTIRYRFPAANAIAYSPDSKTLAVACGSKIVHLVDAGSGKEIRRFATKEHVGRVVFAPDGKTLVAGTLFHLHLWNVATGNEVFLVKSENISQVAVFTPDGKTILHGDGGELVLRDSLTGGMIRSFQVEKQTVFQVAYAPDGKTLASIGQESVSLWNADTGKRIHQLVKYEESHPAQMSIAFAPDGKTLAYADGEVIHLWDPVRGKLLRQLQDEGKEDERGTSSIAFGPDRKTLAAGGYNVCLWNIDTGKEIRRLDSRGWRGRIVFAPDGKTVAGIRGDHAVHVWDVETGKEIIPTNGHQSTVELLAFTPDGKMLASGCSANVLLWGVDTRNEIRRYSGDGNVALSGDARHFARLGPSLGVRVSDIRTGKEKGQQKQKTTAVSSFALSADGKVVAVVDSIANEILFSDVISGNTIGRIQTSQGWTPRPVFAPNGKMLVLRTLNNTMLPHRVTICLCAVPSGKVLRTLHVGEDATKENHSLAFADDGKTIAAAINKNIHVWETATGKEICRINSKDEVLTLSPFGTVLASAAETVHFWDAITGKEIVDRKTSQGWVNSLRFSPDGRTLASGGENTTILLWAVPNVANQERKLALTDKDLPVLWSALASRDAGEAYRAIADLAAAPRQAIPFLQKQLKAKAVADRQHVARLIADLDNDNFAVRQKASAELERLEDRVKPGIREALAGQPSLEVRRRLESLLDKLAYFELRELRAVQVLERTGIAEAKEVLETLAKGGEKLQLTEDARAALDRLKWRSDER